MEFNMFIVGLIMLIFLIVLLVKTFQNFNNIKAIKKDLTEINYHKQYWIYYKMGDYDKAYDFLLKDYLQKVYSQVHKVQNFPELITPTDRGVIKNACEEMGKPVPDFKEIEGLK